MPLTNVNDLAELNPQTLIGFVRNLEYPGYELAEFFPDDFVQGNIAQFDKTQLAQEPAVQYRAWDTEAPIGDRQGIQRGFVQLPPLSKKKLLTEEQSLKLRAIELQDWSAYTRQIYDDLSNLTDGVQARWEIDRGALLNTGALTVTGVDGWTVSVDYGVPSGNKPTAGVLWSNTASADIISDLMTWRGTYRTLNRGLSPGLILIGEAVLPYLLQNAALRASMYYGAPNTGPSVLKFADIQNELAAHGLPPIRVITSQATESNGTTAPVFPQNKVVFLPPGGKAGVTSKGVTGAATGLLASGTLKLNEAPGIVGLTWEENDPARRFNLIDACGMPMLGNPNLIFIAQVAA
jgi:hypothetical protein